MKATRELGEVRITVCRSMLESDSGEMDSARFFPSFPAPRGVENREPGRAEEGAVPSAGSWWAGGTPRTHTWCLEAGGVPRVCQFTSDLEERDA